MLSRLGAVVAASMLFDLASVPVGAQTAPPGGTDQPAGKRPPGGNPGGNGGRQRGPGGGRTFDPAQYRQQQLQRFQQALGATDDEFKVLAPRLDQVMQLQRDASRGGGSTRGGFTSRRSRGGSQGQTGQPG